MNLLKCGALFVAVMAVSAAPLPFLSIAQQYVSLVAGLYIEALLWALFVMSSRSDYGESVLTIGSGTGVAIH